VDRAERLKIWDQASTPLLTPSLLNCNFSLVGEEIAALERAGVVAVHLDVMDGHFVPNLSYGPPVIADWRKVTDMPFDVHLMMSDPGRYLDAFVNAGADSVLVQMEAVPEPGDLIDRIHARGCRAGLVVNPPTPWTVLQPYLDRVDSVLVMSVMPGFGGQAFEPAVLSKVRAIRAAKPNLRISMDGGINAKTADRATEAGATQLVVGSATFRSDGLYGEALAEVAEAARRGLERGKAPTIGASSPE
jgi:ribulose-phosphate 3-epimerase